MLIGQIKWLMENHISLPPTEKEGCNALLLNNLYIQFNFIPWTFFQWIVSNFLHSMSLLLHFQKYPQNISPKNVLELQKSKCPSRVFCLKNHYYISRNTLLHKINKARNDFLKISTFTTSVIVYVANSWPFSQLWPHTHMRKNTTLHTSRNTQTQRNTNTHIINSHWRKYTANTRTHTHGSKHTFVILKQTIHPFWMNFSVNYSNWSIIKVRLPFILKVLQPCLFFLFHLPLLPSHFGFGNFAALAFPTWWALISSLAWMPRSSSQGSAAPAATPQPPRFAAFFQL